MIDFMVLGMPRSSTTWAANWLTTDRTACMHDPLLALTLEEVESLPVDRRFGIADTSLALLPKIVNAHPARKVILHRDRREVDESLIQIGLGALGRAWDGALERLQGLHVPYQDLFDPFRAQLIWEFLSPTLPFDRPRHALLTQMHVEPQFDGLHLAVDRARAFREQVRAALVAA